MVYNWWSWSNFRSKILLELFTLCECLQVCYFVHVYSNFFYHSKYIFFAKKKIQCNFILTKYNLLFNEFLINFVLYQRFLTKGTREDLRGTWIKWWRKKHYFIFYTKNWKIIETYCNYIIDRRSLNIFV